MNSQVSYMRIKENEKSENVLRRCLLDLEVFTIKITDREESGQQRYLLINRFMEIINDAENEYPRLFGRFVIPESKKIKRYITKAKNRIIEIRDMQDAKELTKSHLMKTRKKNLRSLAKAESLISIVTKQFREKVDKSLEFGDDTAETKEMKLIKRENASSSLDDVLKKAEPLLRKMQKYQTKMPTALDKDKPFFIVRVPVLPLFVNILTASDLEDVGFEVQKVSNYSVIMNQLVVGENKNTPEENIFHVISAIEKKTGKKYHAVGSTAGKHNFIWHWLVEERKINTLRQKRKHFNVKEWDFAFTRG